MSTNDIATDRTGYQTTTHALPDSIQSGAGEVRFLRLIRFTHPASPLSIVQYAINNVEQERGLRLDLHKMAFLDHYTANENSELERAAAKNIVAFLASASNPKVQVASGD